MVREVRMQVDRTTWRGTRPWYYIAGEKGDAKRSMFSNFKGAWGTGGSSEWDRCLWLVIYNSAGR
jgi:hypothetical protein